MSSFKKMIADTFQEIADGLDGGGFGKRPRIALTGIGSEHGEENVITAAGAAAQKGIDVTYIGTFKEPGLACEYAENEEACRRKMEELLAEGIVDGAVTMHYPFPIGISTVGRAIAPATGREMFIACTTGTSAGDRVEAMVRNAIYGIIAAKASQISMPTVGILNIDGARQAETILNKLKDRGYRLNWAKSVRADGGAIMRGNDVLVGTPDVLVCDSLTGNVLIKMLAAYTSGGDFETVGWGYGPGIGKGYDKLVNIISRASGAPLITKAVEYAAQMVKGVIFRKAAEEFAAAEGFGLEKLFAERRSSAGTVEREPLCPAAEPCTESIPGIEVMDLEAAARALWKEGIYAETGMGCTGPLVMMSEANRGRAEAILRREGYIG